MQCLLVHFTCIPVSLLLTNCNIQHPLLPVSVPIHTEASVYPLPRAIFRMFGNDDLQDVDDVSSLLEIHVLIVLPLMGCSLLD